MSRSEGFRNCIKEAWDDVDLEAYTEAADHYDRKPRVNLYGVVSDFLDEAAELFRTQEEAEVVVHAWGRDGPDQTGPLARGIDRACDRRAELGEQTILGAVRRVIYT